MATHLTLLRSAESKDYYHLFAGFSDDGDDAASQYTQSSAASSRASTARSRIRATSARTRGSSTSAMSISGRKSVVGMSKPPSAASSVRKNNNWVSTDVDLGAINPPLVPSLFTHISPTIYFTIEGEKGIIYSFHDWIMGLQFHAHLIYNPGQKCSGTISNFPCPPTQCWSVEIKLPHSGHL